MDKNIAITVISGSIIIVIGAVLFFSRMPAENAAPAQTGRIQIVTSFYPLYFLSSRIGGDKASVTNIVPAGAEPHDYEPTAQDMAKMENSRLIVFNGGGLESWSDNIRRNIDTKNTVIIMAGEGLATKQVTADGEIVMDPHVWLDPSLVEKMIDNIAQGFMQADPDNKEYYRANADSLKSEFAGLDMEYRQGLGNCQEKSIITSHDAFGYLADTYGFKQISIAGLSPDAEPSPRQLADIAKFAKDNDVKYIFFESLASPKLAQTIAAEVGARTLVLSPIEGLTDEELAQGKNYMTVMQDNLTNLQTALLCE